MLTVQSTLTLAGAVTLAGALLLAACSEEQPFEDPSTGPRLDLGSVVDLDGREVDPRALAERTGTAAVFVFTRIDCPISNRYAPEVRRLARAFAADGVRFYLVYPNPKATAEEIRAHLADYGYDAGDGDELPALRDPLQTLAAAVGTEVTPEAAVLDTGGRLVYRGRIDDRWVAFGKLRAEPTRRDLQEVLTALVAGDPVEPRTTRAVGCFIEDLS